LEQDLSNGLIQVRISRILAEEIFAKQEALSPWSEVLKCELFDSELIA
jgi:hypothetical protein